MGINLIPTSTAEHLVKSLSSSPNFNIHYVQKNKYGERFFPDREVYIKIPKVHNLRNKRVVVLHSGSPRPNDGLMELELILQILKENKIKPEVFFTYFPYARQDKIFEKGETNVAENIVKKLIEYYEVKKVYVIDPHFGKREWVKSYPIVSISAVPILIKKAKDDFGEETLFFSPDKGGERRTGIFGAKKERKEAFLKISSIPENIKGKTVAVVDDIISTGGTLLKFQESLRKGGAKNAIALITHGVIPSGVLRVEKRFSKLYLTNTIWRKEANVDVSDLIINSLVHN